MRRLRVEAYGLGIIEIDPHTLRSCDRDARFALYERTDGSSLLLTLASADLVERAGFPLPKNSTRPLVRS
jgi:hypothetical protein